MTFKFSPSYLLYAGAGVVVIGLLAFVAFGNSTPSPYNDFAQCLTDKGVKMYGAWWCPHCAAQKKLFGDAFAKINYVECSPNGSKDTSQECKDAGVKSFPTWMFPDGTNLTGEQTFDTLGAKVGCPAPTTATSTPDTNASPAP